VVSMWGVSDRLLFFTASDRGRTREGRAELEEVIGDPRRDLDRLLATSPLFHVDRLDVPLMLVHGGEDRRVDFEHTRRLVRMLNLAGRPPVLLEFPGEGHGIAAIENVETTWQAIAGFLRRHLEPPAPVAADTGTAADVGIEGSESGAR
jgi:dipeptidyl aminopeptidase/acylaminoacyl peptidase